MVNISFRANSINLCNNDVQYLLRTNALVALVNKQENFENVVDGAY